MIRFIVVLTYVFSMAGFSIQPTKALFPPKKEVQKKIEEPKNEPVLDLYGVTPSFSFLFWKANEGSLDYVIKNNGEFILNDPGKVRRAEFDWDVGYRFGLNYEIPAQKMTLGAEWFYFSADGTRSLEVNLPNVLFSVWSIPLGGGSLNYETKARAKADLTLNRIDLGLRTLFSPRRFLELTPCFELTSLWIDQSFDFLLSGGPGVPGKSVVSDHIEMQNNSWSLGPKVGLDTFWLMGKGIGLVCDFSATLFYSFFDVKQKEVVVFEEDTPFPFLDVGQNKFHRGTFSLDTFVGLRLNQKLREDRVSFSIEAGWEHLILFSQNQLMRFVSLVDQGLNLSMNDDLTIQGLSMKASLSF